MKKKLSVVALAAFTLSSFAQLTSVTIPYYDSSKMVYDGIMGNNLKWNNLEKKFEYTGSTSWYDFSSILFNKDGAITFASGNNWQNPLNGFTNSKISQAGMENLYTKMVISRSGEVGIGTRNPSAQLQVVGTVNAKGLVLSKQTSTGNKNLFFCEDLESWGYSKSSIKGDFGIFWNDGAVKNRTAGLAISPHADVKALRIDSKGNVGIGTNLLNNSYNSIDDYFSLAVKGSIRAEEIIVETNWADFVFEDDYQLKTLNEVEKFILKNNHLPDVPSADFIVKNGVKVGDMQKIQMQKIEELTLYTIKQQKELKEQNKLIKILSNRLKKLEKSNRVIHLNLKP